MSANPPSLPPLLFGEAKATHHFDARNLGDQIQRIFPGLNAYDPLGNPRHFLAKSCVVKFQELSVVASSISPSVVDRDGKQEMTLMYPLVGQCEVTISGNTFAWGAGRGGIFMPEFDGRILGRGDARSLLMFQLERSALERTAQAMLGLDVGDRIDLSLNATRLTPMTIGGSHVDPVLRKLASLIELYRCDPSLLFRLGFEDLFYRHIVGLLGPELVLSEYTAARPQRKLRVRATDSVCDAMLSNLGRRWTLTDLEEMSGLSARTLQYAFMRRFGCSPISWLREQRLQRAHRHLLANDFNTITQLAQDCGFGSASQFASYYKERFGAPPSKA